MTISRYVLLDGSNIVQSVVAWDGVTQFSTPFTAYKLPASPPTFRVGDTYNTANDTVTPRADTPDEVALKNGTTLIQRGINALANNATFLAIPSPTNPQAVAQVQALTRQVNALIRLAGKALDTISDT